MYEEKKKPSLLIVDDEANFRETLEMAFNDTFAVSVAGSLAGAKEFMKDKTPDVILLDIRLPDGDGVELLGDLKSYRQKMPVVFMMTAYATVESAVRVLKEGAVDYFIKPFDLEKLRREVAVYIENRFLLGKIDNLDRKLKKIAPPFTTSGIGKMKEIINRVPMIASLDIPVLITGATGTGKERLATWIHSLSGKVGEMVAINCAALPKDIFESELFGYVKGAFSGAVGTKEGLVEKADGGTLFMDEIGELPQTIQTKLLRILEEGVYYKLGDTKERRVSLRIISATSSDLADLASSFRRELFYRINGITFELPLLRERLNDIPLLVSTFINEANYSYKKEVRGVSPEAMKNLMSNDWPGNIRELKWCINRAVAITIKDVLDIEDTAIETRPDKVSLEKCGVDYSMPFAEAIDNLEKRYITHALKLTAGNKTEAAKILSISVRALHYKIKSHHL